MSATELLSHLSISPSIVKYEGHKHDFARFKNDVEIAVLQEFGQEGLEYLTEFHNPLNRFRWDPASLLPTLDGLTEFVDEDDKRIKVTSTVKRDRREENAAIRTRNKEIDRIGTGTFRIISVRCNTQLQMKFKELGGRTHVVWTFLEDNCGPSSLGPQDIGYAFMALLDFKMENNELFSNFIIVFESKTRYVGLSDLLALALLQSEGDGSAKVCLLPLRLQPAVRITKADRLDYPRTKGYLQQQDMLQHSRGLGAFPKGTKVVKDVIAPIASPTPVPASVQRVSKNKQVKTGSESSASPVKSARGPPKCFMCQEVGHLQWSCPVFIEFLAQKAKKSKKKAPSSSDDDAEDLSASEDEVSDDSTEVDVRKVGIRGVRKFGRVRSISPILGIPASRFG